MDGFLFDARRHREDRTRPAFDILQELHLHRFAFCPELRGGTYVEMLQLIRSPLYRNECRLRIRHPHRTGPTSVEMGTVPKIRRKMVLCLFKEVCLRIIAGSVPMPDSG